MCAAACGGGTWTHDVDRSKTAVTAFVRTAGNCHGCRDSPLKRPCLADTEWGRGPVTGTHGT